MLSFIFSLLSIKQITVFTKSEINTLEKNEIFLKIKQEKVWICVGGDQ